MPPNVNSDKLFTLNDPAYKSMDYRENYDDYGLAMKSAYLTHVNN